MWCIVARQPAHCVGSPGPLEWNVRPHASAQRHDRINKTGEIRMKRAIIAATAAAFLGSAALVPTPAAAFFQFFVPMAVLKAKEDKNFKAVNPYAKKVVKKRGKGKMKKK
jgi:hypothetical protein